jgi:hypothetical protein
MRGLMTAEHMGWTTLKIPTAAEGYAFDPPTKSMVFGKSRPYRLSPMPEVVFHLESFPKFLVPDLNCLWILTTTSTK